jgi:hypothetical protein
MRASSLIYEILKGCGVSDNAAKAMETVSEQLLGNKDDHVFVEVNGTFDKDIDSVSRDIHGTMCISISDVSREDIDEC